MPGKLLKFLIPVMAATLLLAVACGSEEPAAQPAVETAPASEPAAAAVQQQQTAPTQGTATEPTTQTTPATSTAAAASTTINHINHLYGSGCASRRDPSGW